MKKNILFLFTIVLLVIVSCKKEEVLTGPDRLFRPVIKTALQADGNWVAASWQKVKGSVSYTVEISRDTFKTIDVSVSLDTNYYLFQDLKWEQAYQVQVKANSENAEHNSFFSNLGNIKTPKFPTILNTPGIADIADNAVKVSWENSGETVTGIKILNATDSSVVKDVSVLATDITNMYKIISGLQSSSKYIIFLYSNTTVRGWANFTTKTAIIGNIIDLRDISGIPNILEDTIPDVSSGSIILLKRGEFYTISSSIQLDKTITIQSGTDLQVPDKAKILLNNNFNLKAGATIDSLVFNDVWVTSDNGYSSKYIFNTTNSATVGNLKFLNSTLELFRGIVRLQSGTTSVDNFIIENCIVDSVSGYGVLTAGNASCKVNNILFTNSTFYKNEKLITSSSPATSIIIQNCTFNEAPNGGNYYFDYSSNNITNPVVISNCIMGLGKSNAGNRVVRPYRVGSNSTFDISGTYSTSDRAITGNEFPSIISYTRSSIEMWKNPASGDFTIIDNLFPGRNSAGDPRWRP